MGLGLETGISAITVFLQGLLSFFSPCVLPLLPLYIGYLSGGAKTVGEDGVIRYRRGLVMRNTLFFVLGVSFAFGLLGLGFSAAGQFFSGNQLLFSQIGGVIVILFGLYQLGVFGSSMALSKERRLPLQLDKMAMNPFTALLLGFAFSFAWTPCVGPVLASVLIMTASAGGLAGFALIAIYTLGFVLPFLAVGLFTGGLLNFFQKHQKVVRYTVKAGGVLMVLMGLMMVTGFMSNLTGYLSSLGAPGAPAQESAAPAPTPSTAEPAGKETPKPEKTPIPAPTFTMTDQYGESHSLEDYKGKVVFMNFWATWCGYCVEELPDIQKLYEDLGENKEDVAVLTIASPQFGGEKSEEEIVAYMEERGYTVPVLMDVTNKTFRNYGISSFPTTFVLDKAGNLAALVPGAMGRETMDKVIALAMQAGEEAK